MEELKERSTEVNRERKVAQVCLLLRVLGVRDPPFLQTRLGNQLNSLETKWTELISNILQIELANAALEAEINDLARKESELSTL